MSALARDEAVLECSIPQLAKSVIEDRTREGVAGFALVEDATGPASLVRIVDPVEHEQRPVDEADLAQCASHRILRKISITARREAGCGHQTVRRFTECFLN